MGVRDERRILERGAIQIVDLPQRRKVEQAGHFDDVAGMHVEFAQQQFQHALGHVVGDLEPHRRAEAPPRQLPFQRLQQIFVAVLLDLHVGVAGDAERVVFDDLHAREQQRQERRDQFLHRQKPDDAAVFALGARSRRREFNEAIDVVGHLDAGEVLAAVLGLAHHHRQVQAQPADEGNGCAGSTARGVRTGKTCSVK